MEKEKQKEILLLKKKLEIQGDKEGGTEKLKIINQDMKQEL